MKNSLLLLAGFAALSLASCSQTATTDTTTTDAPKDGTAMTASTTSDEMYHTRGNRMADKFVGDMKITDEAMKEKIRTAYYNRSKRYGMMREKYSTDTTGMGAAMRQYNTDTDTEFQGVLTDPAQYQSYQSSRSTYDESGNMDQTEQGAATGSTTSPDNGTMNNGAAAGDMSNGSASGSTNSGAASGDMSASGSTDMSSGSGVEKSKSKMSDGSKVKVKTDGSVKMKDGDGTKSKM